MARRQRHVTACADLVARITEKETKSGDGDNSNNTVFEGALCDVLAFPMSSAYGSAFSVTRVGDKEYPLLPGGPVWDIAPSKTTLAESTLLQLALK